MKSWQQVIGQDRAGSVLHQAMAHDRVAHAYLFHGPYGTGKRAAALAFAQALQCKVAPGEGCLDCSDCNRIARMIHPDVRFYFPTPYYRAKKSGDDMEELSDSEREDVHNRLTDLGQNPYVAIDFIRRPTAGSNNKQSNYPKAFITKFVRPVVNFMSFEGTYKIVVFMEAEVLGDTTGNVFLKLLEEPSPRSVFILVSDRPDRLLPTILSRCQPVRFDPLSARQIEAALMAREGLRQEDATGYARLADGSFATARDLLHNEAARKYRERLIPLFRWIHTNDTDQIMSFIKEVSGGGRDEIKLFLGLLTILIRDFLLVRETGYDAPIVNVHEKVAVIKFVDTQTEARLEDMVDLVEEAWHLISRNVHQVLVLTSLVAGLGASMRGERALPLDTPLAEQILSDFE